MPDTPLLDVTIQTREDRVYKGQAQSVTSLNKTGRFDILPYHANFISLIEKYVILQEKDGSKKQFEIGIGVIRVEEDSVHIYLETQTTT